MNTTASTVHISGMTCGACERLITKRVEKIEGVIDVNVSAQQGTARIVSSRPIDTQEVVGALKDTSYLVITH